MIHEWKIQFGKEHPIFAIFAFYQNLFEMQLATQSTNYIINVALCDRNNALCMFVGCITLVVAHSMVKLNTKHFAIFVLYVNKSVENGTNA